MNAFDLAARGDLEAQRQMRSWLLSLSMDGGPRGLETLRLAEFFSRLAASTGDQSDRLVLVQILAKRVDMENDLGNLDEARAFTAEGIAILTELADEGCEDAGNWLNQSVELAGPEVCELAQAIHAARNAPEPESTSLIASMFADALAQSKGEATCQ